MQRVLLVDDDQGDVRLLSEALRATSQEIEVMSARTSADMLPLLPKAGIVLMDLNMPGSSGFEAIRAIRDGPRPRVPIIVLTTSAARGDVERAYEEGANAFITKPSDLLETIEAMERVCRFWFQTASLEGT